jgi:hypothetical protein
MRGCSRAPIASSSGSSEVTTGAFWPSVRLVVTPGRLEQAASTARSATASGAPSAVIIERDFMERGEPLSALDGVTSTRGPSTSSTQPLIRTRAPSSLRGSRPERENNWTAGRSSTAVKSSFHDRPKFR